MKHIFLFIKLPLRTKLIFTEALILLGFSRLLLKVFQFPSIAGILGKADHETAYSNEGIDLVKVKQVSLAIHTMSKYTFWKCKCLTQAYTAKMMLRKRHIKSTVYLGVAKSSGGTMTAHAWVRCGTFYVTGGDGSQYFTITGKFV